MVVAAAASDVACLAAAAVGPLVPVAAAGSVVVAYEVALPVVDAYSLSPFQLLADVVDDAYGASFAVDHRLLAAVVVVVVVVAV